MFLFMLCIDFFLSKYKDMYRKKINKGTTMFPLSNV